MAWRSLIEAIDHRLGTRSRLVVRDGGVAGDGEFRLPPSRSLLDTTRFDRATGFEPSESLEELVDRYAAVEENSSSYGMCG